MQSRTCAAQPKSWSEKILNFFYILHFMHMNALLQRLYMHATKNFCTLLTFTEIWHPYYNTWPSFGQPSQLTLNISKQPFLVTWSVIYLQAALSLLKKNAKVSECMFL